MICMGVLKPWQFCDSLGVTMLPRPVSVSPVSCYSSVKGSASVSSTSGMVGLLCRISAGIERAHFIVTSGITGYVSLCYNHRNSRLPQCAVGC